LRAPLAHTGKLDIIFNNAGPAGALGTLEEITAEKLGSRLRDSAAIGLRWHQIFDSVNAARRVALNHLNRFYRGLARRRGSAALQRAKARVVHLTKCAAIELRSEHIPVNCICSGGIITPLIHKHISGGEPIARQVLEGIRPIPRAGTGADIAGMALYLASDDSKWVTGTAMVIDGPDDRRQSLGRAVPQLRSASARSCPGMSVGTDAARQHRSRQPLR
jgi:NAD(P)-dependent dehydrogenase (short-subunit alcohol dehydrogenase family)